MKRLWLIILLLGVTGCASVQTKSMVFQKGNGKRINLKKGSVCLLSLKTDNKFKPEWPPEVWAMELLNETSNKKINIAVESIAIGSLIKKSFKDAFTVNKNTSSWEGLISFQLPPGSYRITAVRGGCAKGTGIAACWASFDFPFDIPFQVNDEEYIYLGRIEMANRKRVSDDEIPSGNNLATRIPQKSSGFGTGTFDVKVFDNFDEDIQNFKEKYPVLEGQNINKRILPPWKKPNMNK